MSKKARLAEERERLLGEGESEQPLAEIPLVCNDPPPQYSSGEGIPLHAQTAPPRVAVHTKGPVVYITEQGGVPPKPQDYLILGVFTTLCCCLPCGVVALVMSLMVGTRHSTGDYVGARKASQWAKICGLTSLFLGIAWLLLFLLYCAFIVYRVHQLQDQGNM